MIQEVYMDPRVGAVVIGRNEGDRLICCLLSMIEHVAQIVYVDSGSTDGSPARAAGMGVEIVHLDMSIPFTAARARNEGVYHLLNKHPDIEYIQFIDGDCEVSPGWISKALNFLDHNPQYAVVCGRRRERYPNHSVYNLMCDLEWNTPVGEAKACGGDAMMRVKAFSQMGGYRANLIAGEEPELCVRLRKHHWKIWRLDAEMTMHDAAISKFSQWWKRTMRAGHAFAEGAYLHGSTDERHWVKEARRPWIWAFLIPLMTLVSIALFEYWGLLLLLIYPLRILHLALKYKLAHQPYPLTQAVFSLAGKFAEFYGQLRFHFNRWLGRAIRLIEYK